MKKNLSPIIVFSFLLLAFASCTPKVKVCKVDKEMLNGSLYIQYVYDGDRLIRADLYDTTGYSGKYVWTYNTSGQITNVDVYEGARDTLGFSNQVFMNTNGKVDSVQTWVDSNADNIADQFSVTFIYHYTGDKITTTDQRVAGLPSELAITFTYSGNNLTKMEYAGSGIYYVYTHSAVKNPIYEYLFTPNLVSEQGPAIVSEYLANNRKKYDSLDVLLSDVNYVPAEIQDVDGVEIYYPSTGSTRQILKSCVEQ